jgi:RNase P subunit RPR2
MNPDATDVVLALRWRDVVSSGTATETAVEHAGFLGGQYVSDTTDDEANLIEARISGKIKRTSCPYCDNLNWFFLDQRPSPTVVMLLGGRSISTYSFACTNCGYVRQHVEAIVDGAVTAEVQYAQPTEW